MSTTGFRINDANNSDLSSIFNPKGTSTAAANTGFIARDGKDLSQWFQPYSSLKAVTTNYKISKDQIKQVPMLGHGLGVGLKTTTNKNDNIRLAKFMFHK